MISFRSATATGVLIVALTLFGAQIGVATRDIAANTWVNLHAGGVAAGTGVGDEGYNSFVYSPDLRKALVFAQYHAVDVASGEDQNALLAYDVALNRWDILEVTEAAWSEFLPGVGHDQGNVAVDTLHGLYITKGNMTLHGNTAFSTYIYDLKTGRGRRMMPPVEPYFGESAASAFDPDHDLVLTTKGFSALYDHKKNRWTPIEPSPADRVAPGLVYDTKHHIFIMFGGEGVNETWTFDPVRKTWTNKSPRLAPSERLAPNMAFDPEHGVVLLVGGVAKDGAQLSDMWTYDAGTNRWAQLAIGAPPNTNAGAGNNLTYDSDHKIFLLKSTTDLRDVWAFRYRPSPTGPAAMSGRRGIISATFQEAPSADSRHPPTAALPLRTWVARRLPGVGKGPAAGKHMRLSYNPDNRRVYFLGGDYLGLQSEGEAGRREIYSYSIPDNTWRQEHPYCVPAGGVQPANPDEVGWTYDRLRRIFWMLPGYLAGSPWDDPCPQGLTSDKIMTFDPSNRRWTVTDRTLRGSGETFKFAVHDPIADEIIRFYNSGDWGATSQHYQIRTGQYAEHRLGERSQDEAIRDARLGEEYSALDVDGRVIWLIEPVQGRLYRYDLNTKRLTFEADTPVKNAPVTDIEAELYPWDCAMPIWDGVNKVLLWPHVHDFSTAGATGKPGDRLQLYIYNPRTKRWDKDAMIQPEGIPVRGNAAVFDPEANALLMLGGTYPPNDYFFLYRYGLGPDRSPTPR